MSTIGSAAEVLDREFFEIRANLLQLAASLDRMDRASGPPGPDEKIEQIRQALAILQRPGSNRAEQIQLVFSLPYDSHWRERFDHGLH